MVHTQLLHTPHIISSSYAATTTSSIAAAAAAGSADAAIYTIYINNISTIDNITMFGILSFEC